MKIFLYQIFKINNMNEKGLKLKANDLRQHIVKMVHNASSGHLGGALGLADIFAALYFKILKHDPNKPEWKQRDRLVMSNGHACAVLYASMAESGYFPVKELMTFRRIRSRLQGHPAMHHLPGIETSSGSLGQGLSMAVGKALAAKIDKQKHRIYAVISEGDLDEGNTWEAINATSKWKLDNLITIIDRNNIQICGETEDVWPLEPLDKKFKSFNWKVIKINGNNIKSVLEALKKSTKIKVPVAIIAKNTLGKGVSFMENKSCWHGKAPNEEELKKAMEELQIERSKIK